MTHYGSAAFAALALGLSTTGAVALDLGSGFSIVGDVELEFNGGNGDDESLGFTDLTLGWRSASGIGVDLTFVSITEFDGNDDESALWGGIVFTTGLGDVTVGRPRPLMADMSSAPYLGSVRAFSAGELGLISGSFVDLIGMYSDNLDVYGITLEGESGALRYGLGLHSLRAEGQSVEAIEVTARYQLDSAEVYGGFETVDVQPEAYTKVMLGGRFIQERWSAGVELSNIKGFGPGDSTFTKLFGDYEVIDGLTLGMQYEDWGDAGGNLIGLNGIYGFGSGGFAELGYVSNTDGDHVTSASIGFRF